MKTIRLLLRQPLKVITGIILVAIAAVALSVSMGQVIALSQTKGSINDEFNTVALIAPKYGTTYRYSTRFASINNPAGSTEQFSMLPETSAWIKTVAEAADSIIKIDSHHGLASAYISELEADNYTQHRFYLPLSLSTAEDAASATAVPLGAPYCCALLTVEIASAVQKMTTPIDGKGELVPSRQWTLSGTVKEVHSLQDGFNDPTGWSVQINLLVDKEDQNIFEPADFVGKRTLVYTTSYYDADWELRERIRMEYENLIWGAEEVIIEAFDLENITYLSEAEIERNKQSNPRYYDVARYMHGFKSIGLSERELSAVRSIWMTDPEIVLLEGAAEDFLASAEGAQWAEYLEYSEINSHAFPIIGVDKLGYIGNFAQETARIVDGRDFTQDELDNGAKVCIMAQSLAQANGLSVGDTINPRYYEFDPEMKGQYLVSDGWGTTNPSAYFYGANTPWAGDAEEYTIVGLYRCDNEWGDPQENLYSFTPNTIFVPKNSVTGTMDYGDQAFFRTIVLEHGAIPQFRQLVEDAGYEGLFVYYDQGYSEIADSLHDYEASARRAAMIGAIVSGVLLLLFLFFFPARHGKTLAVMSSLGATRGRRYRYIVADTLCLLIPGTVLGCVAGLLLWKQVAAKLMSTAQFTLDVPSSAGSLLPSVLALFLFTLCLVLLLAVPLSKGKHPMKRK